MKKSRVFRMSHTLGMLLVLIGLVALSNLAQSTAPASRQAVLGSQNDKKSSTQTLIKVEPDKPKTSSSSSAEPHHASSVSVSVQSSSSTSNTTSTSPPSQQPVDPPAVTPPAPPTIYPTPDQPEPVCSCGGKLYARCADCLPAPRPPVCNGCGSNIDSSGIKHAVCPQYCLY